MSAVCKKYPLPIVGTSESINRACLLAEAAARYDVNALILGESGVGKELFARTIHLLGPRKDKPFIAINCSAIPETLLESEIFGYERGAFTGAYGTKMGRLEMANGGTLFLDEVGEMSPFSQIKLLRVLEKNKSFERLGGTRSITVDVRIIAATNAELKKKIEQGAFRKDLFYRLNEFTFSISPIRERGDDIRQLIDYYLDYHCQRLKINRPDLSLNLFSSLITYSWPGNVRELDNALLQALIAKDDCDRDLDLTDFSHLDFTSEITVDKNEVTEGNSGGSLKETSAIAAEKLEKELVLKMLETTNWNRKAAAFRLKISYKSLLRKFKKWGFKAPPLPY